MNDRVLRKIKTHYHRMARRTIVLNYYQQNHNATASSYANWKRSGTTANESLKGAKFREKPCMQLLQK